MPDKPPIFGRHKPAQRLGGSPHLRDHSSAYRCLCGRILAAEPLCRYCRHDGRITPARVVDHVVALALGGNNDGANLAPACARCNDAKGRVEARFVRGGYDIRDIMADIELADWIMRGRRRPDG